MSDFKQKCIDWLSPLGYSVSASMVDESYIFTKNDFYHPAIMCTMRLDGIQTCELYDAVTYKMGTKLTSGQIAFRHPNIQKYIDTFVHYAKLVEQYPPF